MPISALKKLLQLIKNEEEPQELPRSLEETLESKANESEEEMQNAECEMQNAECEMQNAECKMQNAECEMQNADEEAQAPGESNRAHLTSSVPRVAKAPVNALTKGELAEIRALFKNLDDTEIQRLYKKVTK